MGKPKRFVINLSEDNLVYFAGSTVEGNVLLELSEPKRAQDISISFSGKAYVYWTKSYTTGSGDNRHTETIVYSDTQTFFSAMHRHLWGNENESQELAVGTHEFPFKFQLPSNTSYTTLPTSFESHTGYIRYSLVAEIKQSWKIEHTTTRAINVNDVVNINTPQLTTPLSGSCDKTLCCFCCVTGPVSLTAKIDRGGYCPGESISITTEAENRSNIKMNCIRATLKQKVVFKAGFNTQEKSKIIQRIEGHGIRRHATLNWNNELLPIPATIPSITNCRCIKLSYILTVTIGIPGATDLHVNIPVTIGNVPFQGEESDSISNTLENDQA